MHARTHTRTHTRARTHARTHTRTHARTRARAPRMHARTHAHKLGLVYLKLFQSRKRMKTKTRKGNMKPASWNSWPPDSEESNTL